MGECTCCKHIEGRMSGNHPKTISLTTKCLDTRSKLLQEGESKYRSTLDMLAKGRGQEYKCQTSSAQTTLFHYNHIHYLLAMSHTRILLSSELPTQGKSDKKHTNYNSGAAFDNALDLVGNIDSLSMRSCLGWNRTQDTLL